MKRSLPLALVALVCLSVLSVPASGQEPSKKEILAAQLLDQLQMQKMFDSSFNAMPKMQAQAMAAQESKMTPEEKAKLAKRMQTSMQAAKEAMSWDSIKPIFVKIYADNFDEAELQGMIAFYKTPVGQKWIEKQPEVQAATMQAMGQLMPKIQAAIMKSNAGSGAAAGDEEAH